jgi:hypothetical protein
MISRSSRWTGVASVILPNPRRRRIDGRRAFSALRRRRRGRGRSMCSCPRCAIGTEFERFSDTTRGIPSISLQARHSARASCGCDVRNNGSVSAGSLCLSMIAKMPAARPSRDSSDNEMPSKAAMGILSAMRMPRTERRSTTRSRAAVRPQWYRLRRTALASQTGRAARRGPTRRIRHNAFDASKLSRAQLFCRVARQSCRKHVRIRLMFWVNRK